MLEFKQGFPLQGSALVDCLTNNVTIETMANSLLYVGAKPIMAAHTDEQDDVIKVVDAVLLNLGRILQGENDNLQSASQLAKKYGKPFIVDLVGYGIGEFRNNVGEEIIDNHPSIVKGNMSEIRAFCKLKSHGRGVDVGDEDTTNESLDELIEALKNQVETYTNTVFMVTGPVDVIVSKNHSVKLYNGVENNGNFTGTGDAVGALAGALIGDGMDSFNACINAVSYFNICGEIAEDKSHGLNDFRFHLLNELSLLKDTDWTKKVKGEYV